MVDLLGALISAFLGMVVTALLSPLFSERIIRFYSQLGFFQPNISVNASVTKSFYEEGKSVEKFNDIEWQPSYEILTLNIKNKGNAPIYNIRLSLFFPGFIRAVNISQSSTHEISLGSPHNEIEMFNHQDKNVVKPCSQRPYISQIDEHGDVRLEFLIDTDTSIGGAYAFWNPTTELKGSLHWEAKGVRLPGQFTDQIRDDVGIYDDVQEPKDFKITLDEYPFPGSNPDITLGVLDDPTENPLYEKYKDKLSDT